MKGMYTCKICGRDFPLLAEEHYVTKEPGRTGVLTAISDVENKLHDAFDCPHCGCQNLVGVREDLYCGCCEFEDECNGDGGGGDDSLSEDDEEDDPDSIILRRYRRDFPLKLLWIASHSNINPTIFEADDFRF